MAVFHYTFCVSMENIGNRLTEARKRLGVALREASEATKIRTDYLQAMENGSFDFSLPDIYKIGFLKIYARYLKLDADKYAADYVAQFSGAGVGSRENLGRIEAPGGGASGQSTRDAGTSDYDTSRAQNQAELWRLLIIFGGTALALVLLIGGGFYLYNHAGSTESTNKGSATATSNVASPAATSTASNPVPSTMPAAPATLNFVFTAKGGNISSLQITQLEGQKQLYSGPLSKGSSLPKTSQGPVRVIVSETQFLNIQVNGGAVQGIADGNHQPIIGPANFTWGN